MLLHFVAWICGSKYLCKALNNHYFSIFTVLAVSFSSSFTSQTTDCLQVREQCINAANGCESVWNIIEDVCKISGNSCKAKDSVVCNKVIQFLANQYPKLKSGLCTKNDSCSIKMLLEQQCGLKKEHLDPSANSDIQLNFMLHTKHKDIKHTGERENDCNIAKQSCRDDHYCFVEYKNFRRVCRAEVAKCSLQVVGKQCLSAWKKLRKTVLGNCRCSEPLQKRCTKIWKSIFNNTCLQDAKENIAFDEEDYDDERDQDTDTDNINVEIKLQWNLSALSKQEHTENGTCLDVNRECIEDEVCNRQLSLYLKVCSVNKKCNMKECQAAIRFFYQNMPFNVAQMLTFCDCTQLDKSCQKAKELLHGKPCAVNIVPPPSCLSIIRQCQNNELCRKKYEMFWSMCWRHVTRRCYEDKACLETLIKDDMTCSGSADCRAAYIDNWGTMLRVECSCNTVPLAEQPLCKLFQHMLHGKSCFKQISSEKTHFHWMHTDRPGEKLPRTRLQSSFKGETIHIIAYTSCIILILGIVMLALLKTRACRTTYQSRHTSPDHSSETFGIH
ncbi:GDNF family receptor alpha-like [Alligator sinensis]|uniref:GDNF family receptor alpha-like n=1 Tax=Alligator sinensis TaxID=38654 RepID=A0A3Q0FP14_ALLSI|nr:GDNF family receptor alpha-like [Alligator sinensis]